MKSRRLDLRPDCSIKINLRISNTSAGLEIITIKIVVQKLSIIPSQVVSWTFNSQRLESKC